MGSWRRGVTACAAPFIVLAVWWACVLAAEAAPAAADAALRPMAGVSSRAAAAPVAAPSAKEKTVRIHFGYPRGQVNNVVCAAAGGVAGAFCRSRGAAG